MASRLTMVYIFPMPAYPHIERYHADKQRFIDFGAARSSCDWDGSIYHRYVDRTIPLSLTQ